MQSSYFIEQGEWLIPTLNSLDTAIFLKQEVNTLSLVRTEKLTVLFEDADITGDPNDNLPTEVDIHESLQSEIEQHITGIPGDWRICNLPYSFRAEFSAFAGAGLDIFIAGIDGSASVNVAGGFETCDDRTFQFYGEFNIDASLKWKVIFFANGNVDWSLFGIKKVYIFDDVNHCVEWLLNKIYRFFWTVGFNLGIVPTLPPPATPIITSVKRRVNKMIGYGVEYKGIGYSSSFIDNNEVQIQTKNGHVKLGQTSDTSYSFRLRVIENKNKNVAYNLYVELYWNKTRGSYNSDNDGDYFGYKIMYETTKTDSKGTGKSTHYDAEMLDRLNRLNNNKFFQQLADLIDKLDKRSISNLNHNSTVILNTFRTNLQGVINTNMADLTVDNQLSWSQVKSINKTKLKGFGVQVHQVLEEGKFKTQYHRFIFKGQTTTTKQREFYLWKIAKVFIGYSFSFQINAGFWEYYDPFFVLPSDYTESYVKTIFNGVNLNIKSDLDFYGYQNRICWSIYKFLPFFRLNREGFNKVIPVYNNPGMMPIPAAYPKCVTYLAEIRSTKYMDERELLRFNYLEKSRIEKEIAEDKAWYTDPFKTTSVDVLLEEKWNSVSNSWQIKASSNLYANGELKELYLDELLEMLTHDLSTTLTLKYKVNTLEYIFIDKAKSEINRDLSNEFKAAFYTIIEPKEKINENEFFRGYNNQLLNSKVVWYTDEEMKIYFEQTINKFKLVFSDDPNILALREIEETSDDQEFTKDDLITNFISNYANKYEKLKASLNDTVLLYYKVKIQEQNREYLTPIQNDMLHYNYTLPEAAPSDDANDIKVSDEIVRGIVLQMMLSEFMDIIVHKAMKNIKV